MYELIFITSSNEKLAHARYLCRNYAVIISKQKNYGIGYVEPRIENRDELIKKSVEDAINRFEKTTPNAENKFFFIEDTSVIINALSKEKEYPGVDIKYWMRENNFSSIDKMLKEAGNDRSVIVRSDVILVIPKNIREKVGADYKIFTSLSKGIIAEKEYEIKTQPLYPWLNDRTFNRFFIPDGANEPLSLLPIEQADKYDFRINAFSEMLSFLWENGFIKTKSSRSPQFRLFEPFVFIICGPTCAGKTTLASHLLDKFNYYHIEASDFMYLSYYESHGIGSSVHIADFAEEALKKNPSIVSDQIIKNIERLKYTPIVITGFRSPDEIESFESKYKGGLYIEPIYISADQEKRFNRSVLRGRSDNQSTLENFKKKDEQQDNMGLKLINELLKSSIVENNDTIENYLEKFESLYQHQLGSISKNNGSRETYKGSPLQNAIILSLHKQEDSFKFYTTTEIANLIKSNLDYKDHPKNKNNISRYFNQYFHPYFDIEINSSNVACYRLSQTGKAYAKWLIRKQESELKGVI